MPEYAPTSEFFGPLQINELFRGLATPDQIEALERLQRHFVTGADSVDASAASQLDMHHDLMHVGTELARNTHYEFQSRPSEHLTRLTRTTDEGSESVIFGQDNFVGHTTTRWQPSAKLFRAIRLGENGYGPLLSEARFCDTYKKYNDKLAGDVQALIAVRVNEVTLGFLAATEQPKGSIAARLGRNLLRGFVGTDFKS